MANIPKELVENALIELDQPYDRPTVIEWLRYAVGARVTDHMHTWVLHDVTARTWWLRHASRVLTLLCIPVLLALAFIPASLAFRLEVIANAGFPSFLGGMLFVLSSTERRLVNAGYPAELGQAVRHTLAVRKQSEDNRARRERIEARRAKRR